MQLVQMYSTHKVTAMRLNGRIYSVYYRFRATFVVVGVAIMITSLVLSKLPFSVILAVIQ